MFSCPQRLLHKRRMKMTLRENRIPFDIKGSSDPYWNKSNLAYLRKSVAEIEAGHYQAHDLIEDD